MMETMEQPSSSRSPREIIHSGHFMVSDIDDSVADDDDANVCSVQVSIAESELNLDQGNVTVSADSNKILPQPGFDNLLDQNGFNFICGYDFNAALKEPSPTYNFGMRSSKSISIDATLTKLFQCMTLAYSGKLTSPRWKTFKGLKLRWKDKIRLNNLIWRAWHLQFIKSHCPKICQFASPLDTDAHNKPEAVVLEGKYWKRRMDTVYAEYKSWRLFFKKKLSKQFLDRDDMSTTDINAFDWQPYSNQSSLSASSMVVDDDPFNEFSDTLFSCLIPNQPYAFPNAREIARGAGIADFMQPGLVQFQPNLDEIMDTFEILTSKLPTVVEENDNYGLGDILDSSSSSRHSEFGDIDMFASPFRPKPYSQRIDAAKTPQPQQIDSSATTSTQFLQKGGDFTRGSGNNCRSSNSRFYPPPPAPPHPPGMDMGMGPLRNVSKPAADRINAMSKNGDCTSKLMDNYFAQNLSMGQPQLASSLNMSSASLANLPSSSSLSSSSSSSHRKSKSSMNILQKPQQQMNFSGPMPNSSELDANSLISQTLHGILGPPIFPNDSMASIVRRASTGQEEPAVSKALNDGFALPQATKSRARSRSGPNLGQNHHRSTSPGSNSGSSTSTLSSSQSTSSVRISSPPNNAATVSAHPRNHVLAELLTKGTRSGTTKKQSTCNKTSPVPILPSPHTPSSSSSSSSAASSAVVISPITLATVSGVNDFQSRVLVGATSQVFGGFVSPGKMLFSPGNTVTQVNSLPSSPLGTTDTRTPSPPKSFKQKGESDRVEYKEHRRVCHINAEQKRRCNIKNGFDTLHHLVPSLNANPNAKVSKAAMLQKAGDYIKVLKSERAQLQEETDTLKKQVESLNQAINVCQSQLPASGVLVNYQRRNKLQKLFEEYVRSRTLLNWKFWIFSILIRPLLDSYNSTVSITCIEDLCKTVLTWLEQHCSLVALRPVVFNSLRHLSTTTNILSDPSRMQEEAVNAIKKL